MSTFTLPKLPYADDALAPVISSQTVGLHYGKHHRGYFDKMVKLVENTDFANRSVEQIIRATAGKPEHTELFNNAAQFWNHNFYWSSMRGQGGGKPPAPLAARIDQAFGNYEGFRKAFADAANGQFGSGWAWLVENKDKKLEIVKTSNAETPIAQGTTCLLTCDVWEHAYYLDYKNMRADYVAAWLDKLVNWGFVEQNLTA